LETLENAQANGVSSTPSPSPAPDGFDASNVWVFPYTLEPYVKASGHIPPPSQERIDRFQVGVSKFWLEYERAAREAEKAQANVSTLEEEKPLEEALAEVDRAVEEKNVAVGKMKDAVADLCNGHPTRKQLDKLPEYVFMSFISVIGRKLNPEA
jgi:hypothetical protein